MQRGSAAVELSSALLPPWHLAAWTRPSFALLLGVQRDTDLEVQWLTLGQRCCHVLPGKAAVRKGV